MVSPRDRSLGQSTGPFSMDIPLPDHVRRRGADARYRGRTTVARGGSLHSYGGQVALELAIRAPELVSRLTLWFSPAELAADGPVVRQVRRMLVEADRAAWSLALRAIATFDCSTETSSISCPDDRRCRPGSGVHTGGDERDARAHTQHRARQRLAHVDVHRAETACGADPRSFTAAVVVQTKKRVRTFVLTRFSLVELPGIEAAYIACDLQICTTGQHDSTWENMGRDENVLTAVSTSSPHARRRLGLLLSTRDVS